MTQAQIHQLMRPYLARRKHEKRKRQIITAGLTAMASLWVAVLLWLLFLLTFKP